MENQKFRVIVAGGRDFFDYNLLKEKLEILLLNKENVIIVSGLAKGADTLAVRYAKEHKLLVSYFPAQIGRASCWVRVYIWVVGG